MTQFKHQYRKESNRLKDEWRTPPETFNPLNDVFQFTIDVASTDDNALCAKHHTAGDLNGLNISWRNERVWCNSPYTEGQYANWLIKAAVETSMHNARCVMLVPASLETAAFEPVWKYANYLVLPYKRLSFLRPDGTRIGGAPFASAIAVFGFKLSPSGKDTLIKHVGHVIPLFAGFDYYQSKFRQG